MAGLCDETKIVLILSFRTTVLKFFRNKKLIANGSV